MTYLLNIGLARHGNSNTGAGTVLREITSSGFALVAHQIHRSDTEVTVVAEVVSRYSFVPVAVRVAHLSDLLGQDCIAVYNPTTQQGYLAGSRVDAWGPFNPEFFLLLDGTRLSDQVRSLAA